MIPDEEVATCLVLGDPQGCLGQLEPLIAEAERLGVRQISLANPEPDYDEATRLLAADALGKLPCGLLDALRLNETRRQDP